MEELYYGNSEFKRYVDKYCSDYGYTRDEALGHALVREVVKEYMHAKVVGEDYRQQIMERFLKVR